jgi:hypothetical protein
MSLSEAWSPGVEHTHGPAPARVFSLSGGWSPVWGDKSEFSLPGDGALCGLQIEC